MKRAEKKQETPATTERIPATVIDVKNVRELEWGIVFDLTVNGATFYSCRAVEGKNGDFIAFPSYKGKNGKYYTHCYFPLSDEEQEKILDLVEQALT